MGKEIITFANIEVEKHKFHQHKNQISIKDVNNDRIVEKKGFGKKGFKYFLGTKMILSKLCPCV